MKFISPISIVDLMLQHKEWIDWEPETIWCDIDDMYSDLPKGQPKFPPEFKDIVMAIKLCIMNNMAWEQWNAFSQVVMAFNNIPPSFNSYLKPTLAQVAYAVYVMNKIKVNKFSDEVASFVACVAKDDGMIALPCGLEFAQETLELLNPHIRSKMVATKEAWGYCIVKGSLPSTINDDNFIAIQCAKLMAIDKYVKQKISIHKEGTIVKLAAVLHPLATIGSSAIAGLAGFALSKDEAEELAKYIHLDNRTLAIRAAKDGIILQRYDTNFCTMDDDSVADLIKTLTHKSADSVGAIYKRLYSNVMERGYIVSPIARAAGRVGEAMSSAKRRLHGFIGDTLFKKKEEEQ